jgi:hypothetical protein
VVTQEPDWNVVNAHVTFGEKVMVALGTVRVWATPLAVKLMVEAVKVNVAPVLGMPLALKFALNQMKFPASMGVPLKLELFVVLSEHTGGDGQLKVEGEKVMDIVLNPSKVAVPDGVNVPPKGPIDFVIGPLSKVVDLAVNVIEPLIVGPRPEIVQSIV